MKITKSFFAERRAGERARRRLYRLLVASDKPQAVSASALEMRLEDAGVFNVEAIVMQGRDPDAVQKVLDEAAADVIANGVTQEELDRAKTQEAVALAEANKPPASWRRSSGMRRCLPAIQSVNTQLPGSGGNAQRYTTRRGD